MRRTISRSLLVFALFGFVASCDELLPPEPEQPAKVVAKPVKKPVAAAPVVKKKPVIVFDDGSGGGGWDG